MHVGWDWIKQRPHFLAEELAQYYDLTIISEHIYRMKRSENSKKKENDLPIKEFYKIPFLDHYLFLKKINMLLRRLYYLWYVFKIRPQYIYVMTPAAVYYIPGWYKGKLIYDCMDDMLAFTSSLSIRQNIRRYEEQLIQKADFILVSSDSLNTKLIERYGRECKDKILTVRNGFDGIIKAEKVEKNEGRDLFTLCYFGTVAEWINFEFILCSLEDKTDIQYIFIGPLQSGVKIPKHDRLKYIGPAAHKELDELTQRADAFVMPFKLSELIESVDPVKLYEYINFDKNILCVRYQEIERFENFVFFYESENYQSYLEQLTSMQQAKDVKYSESERIWFLSKNSWNKRAEDIFRMVSLHDEN